MLSFELSALFARGLLRVVAEVESGKPGDWLSQTC